ncbi:hypothetical protein NC651_029900 [Populus alba x Populus x berolinensis]|nr:hypothetical protein NC651_029900 [Populus alba x Populus x berolinensis]
MAGICSLNPTTLMTFKVTKKGTHPSSYSFCRSFNFQRIHGIRFFSGATDNENKSQIRRKERYLPYYSPSSIAFSACFLGRCPETNKMKQINIKNNFKKIYYFYFIYFQTKNNYNNIHLKM